MLHAKYVKAYVGRTNTDADALILADRGYFKGEEILACDEAGIEVMLPKLQISGSQAGGRFGKRDFHYVAEYDAYRCPAGDRLIWRLTTREKGQMLHRYWSSACPGCPIKAGCTPSPYRRVTRWEHEPVLEAAQARLDRDPDKMRLRRQTAEHPKNVFTRSRADCRLLHCNIGARCRKIPSSDDRMAGPEPLQPFLTKTKISQTLN